MSNKKILTGLYILLSIAVAFIAQSCRKTAKDLSVYIPGADTRTDSILLYNLLPDSSFPGQIGYVLYVNDSLYLNEGRAPNAYEYSYGVPTSFGVPAQGGVFNFQLIEYKFDSTPPPHFPAGHPVLVQKTITVPAHSGFSYMFFYDSANAPAIGFMPIGTADPGAPAPGTFKLRVINYSYNMPAGTSYSILPESNGPQYYTQLQYADSTVVSGDDSIPFGTATAYRQFDYGTQQFLVYNATTKSYTDNSGPLNDVTGTFDLEYVLSTYVNSYYNYVAPHLETSNSFPNYSTTHLGSIGSYPFSAGGCYSVLVIGDIYAVVLDRMYGAGTLDNFGKLQIVNADPDAPSIQVSITDAGGQTQQVPDVSYGSYAIPNIVAAGNVTCTFTSNGQTLATYSTSVPRLGAYTLYFTEDQNNLPLVYPVNTIIDPNDYTPGSYSSPVSIEQIHVRFLNLSPDAGNVFFTDQVANNGNAEIAIQAGLGSELPYKGQGSEITFNGAAGYAPDAFNLRLSSGRTDSLAAALVATLKNPFPKMANPGSYTLVAAGSLLATDSTRKLRLFLVQQSNFIQKAL